MDAVSSKAAILPPTDTNMDALSSRTAIWEAIDLSETYLVCCMNEQAVKLSNSILRRLLLSANPVDEPIEEVELFDMVQAAAMVMVQAMKPLGRSLDIFIELEELFGSVASVPGLVVFTGAYILLSEGFISNVRPILERYLKAWKFDDSDVIYRGSDAHQSSEENICWHPILTEEEYLNVVHIYAVQLLGIRLQNFDLAISWIENAHLPEEDRQELLRILHSLESVKNSSSSSVQDSPGINESCSMSSSVTKDKRLSESVKEQGHPDVDSSKLAIPNALQPFFCWFPTIHLKWGNAQVLLKCGKTAVLGTLVIFICYLIQKKWKNLQGIAARTVNSIRKALMDAWQLAFSVQVNPLAAVQPLPAAPHGSR